MVIATDPETGETYEKMVVGTHIRQSNRLVHIRVDGKETEVTPERPYYVIGKGWVDAGEFGTR